MVMLSADELKEADSLIEAVNADPLAKLTPGELYFCELIHFGHGQGVAYLKAHPKSKMTLKSANSTGCRLVKEPRIQAYLARFRDGSMKPQSANPVLSLALADMLDRDAKRVLLAGVIRNEEVEINARLRAIELDNKMAGHEAPRTTVTLAGPLSMAKTLLDRYAQRSIKTVDSLAITNELPKLASIPAIETSATVTPIAPSGIG